MDQQVSAEERQANPGLVSGSARRTISHIPIGDVIWATIASRTWQNARSSATEYTDSSKLY